jgi:4,5-dihydroxyphthalate decarboxylase
MSEITLSLGMADYDRTAPLRNGQVKPEGFSLNYVVSPPSETFWRMLRFEEFDTSEMSMSSYLISRQNRKKWLAIPVFPFRSLFHSNIFVNKDAGINSPEDLIGRKFGLPEYQVTAALWLRGTLEHEFGVKPSQMKWYVERQRNLSHGGETGFKAPSGVSINQVSEGNTLVNLLERGELDAIMPSPYPGMRSMLNKTDYLSFSKYSKIKPLFDDPLTEGKRYYKKNRFTHINHTVIVKENILSKYQWVPLNLLKAFQESKEIAYSHRDQLLRSSLMFAYSYMRKEQEIFGEDLYPYGYEANKKAIETLVEYSIEQELTKKSVDPEELFVESTRLAKI